MLASRITFAHIASSVSICLANSAGVLTTVLKPSSTSRSFVSGLFAALAI